jgi:GDP-L-fucose synthase
MFKDSRIYLAGHTGLLGSALQKSLKRDGYQNIITRTHEQLDLTRQKEVEDFFKKEKPEYVFLAAGLTGGIGANQAYPERFLHINIAIQDNVFQASDESGVSHLIFYGSSCVYPKDVSQPIKEEYLFSGPLEETSLAYAAAKIAGLTACKAYNIKAKANRFIALVPNTMYGPNDNFELSQAHVLSALIKKFYQAKVKKEDKVLLWGSGSPRREFIFCEDVASASIFAAVNAKKLENSHYNVGTGQDYSIAELARMIAGIVGFDGEIAWDKTKPDGTLRKLLDSSKFLALGWRPATSLEEGLGLTCKWYEDNLGKE